MVYILDVVKKLFGGQMKATKTITAITCSIAFAAVGAQADENPHQFQPIGAATEVRADLVQQKHTSEMSSQDNKDISANSSTSKKKMLADDDDGDKGDEGKCGEGKCGDQTKKKKNKSDEGKCGEGKCGDKQKKNNGSR